MMTKIQECLSDNIRFYRRRMGLTQAQLAEKVNTSTNYISILELGKKYPSPQMIEKLAAAFRIESPLLFVDRSKIISRDFDSYRFELLQKMEKAITDTFNEICNQ